MNFPPEKAYPHRSHISYQQKSQEEIQTRRISYILHQLIIQTHTFAPPNNCRPRSTMDSIRVSEAPDPGSIPGEATHNLYIALQFNKLQRYYFVCGTLYGTHRMILV